MAFRNPNSGNGIFFRNDEDEDFGEIVEQSRKRHFYQENNVISGFQSSEQVSDKRVRLYTEINRQEENDGSSEESRPLGLNMNITPSFVKLVQRKLYQTRKSADQKVSRAKKDCKELNASKFPATSLRIGNWECSSSREGGLTAKIYYAKKKIMWEILDGSLKSKIELKWSTISGIKAVLRDNESGILEIELDRPPLFFREKNPQPRKRTIWQDAEDFTGDQYRRHYLVFPPGVLDSHYEKLLQCDKRLSDLSKKPFPTQNCALVVPPHIVHNLKATSPSLVIVDSPTPMSVLEFPHLGGKATSCTVEKQTTMLWSTQGVSNNQGQSSMTMATQGSRGFPDHQDFPPMNPVENSGIITPINETPFWEIEKHLLGHSEVECPDDDEFLQSINSMDSILEQQLNFNANNNNNNNNIIANDLVIGNVSNTNEYSGVNDGLVFLPPQNSNANYNMMMNPPTNEPLSPYAFSEPTVDDFAALGSSQNISHWG